MADKALLAKVNMYLNNPKARAALDMIAASEGTAGRGNNGYNVQFGGGLLSDMRAHPNSGVKFRTKTGSVMESTAAGRYQFLNSTWNDMAKRLGLTDFSEKSQDMAALGLMLSIPGVEQAINSGDVSTLVNKLNSTWTSLPGSVAGNKYHNTRDFGYILGAYNQSAMKSGLPAAKSTWNGQTYTNTTAPIAQSETQYNAGPVQPLSGNTLNGYVPMFADRIPMVGNVASDVLSRSYANAGSVPFNITQGNITAISTNMDMEDPNNRADLLNRLYNPDPNVTYGMSFTGGSIRPTITRTNPDGTQQGIVEMGPGNYIDAQTQQRVNRDGTPYVDPNQPVLPNTPIDTEPGALNLDALNAEMSPNVSVPVGATTASTTPLANTQSDGNVVPTGTPIPSAEATRNAVQAAQRLLNSKLVSDPMYTNMPTQQQAASLIRSV